MQPVDVLVVPRPAQLRVGAHPPAQPARQPERRRPQRQADQGKLPTNDHDDHGGHGRPRRLESGLDDVSAEERLDPLDVLVDDRPHLSGRGSRRLVVRSGEVGAPDEPPHLQSHPVVDAIGLLRRQRVQQRLQPERREVRGEQRDEVADPAGHENLVDERLEQERRHQAERNEQELEQQREREAEPVGP